MKNKFKKLSTISIIFLGLTNLQIQAQEAISTTGGDSNGSNGSVSYSIGQVVYSTNIDVNGNSVSEGVQQPYEISVTTSIPEAKDISLKLSAYPNPTTEYLTIKVEDYKFAELKYLFFDINGKLLKTVKATGKETNIKVNNLIPANYFVKVIDSNKEIKVFKIIKIN